MKKINLGDIFELATKRGFIYLQMVKFPKDQRNDIELVRIYYELHRNKANDLSLLQTGAHFYVQFPVCAAFRRSIIERVGNIPLEHNFQAPRYFRTENLFGDGWQIVDAETLKRETLSELTDEQKLLSPWGIWNDTYIIERMDEGWTLENWILKQ